MDDLLELANLLLIFLSFTFNKSFDVQFDLVDFSRELTLPSLEHFLILQALVSLLLPDGAHLKLALFDELLVFFVKVLQLGGRFLTFLLSLTQLEAKLVVLLL